MWMEVPIPEGAMGYNFMFFKPDGSLCRTVLLTTTRDINEYPPSIDETLKYVDNPADGTIGIEHYVRRLVTYLSRLQSVTQSNAKGLTLKVYVKLDTKEWLRMYARLYHACERTSCTQLPDPVMVTAAAFVKDDDDLNGDLNTQKRDTALRAVRTLRNELGLGGRPDAASARSQATLLAADFDLVARNRNTGSCVLAGESLRNKGWHDLRAVTPRFSGNQLSRNRYYVAQTGRGNLRDDGSAEVYLDDTRSSLDAVNCPRQSDMAI